MPRIFNIIKYCTYGLMSRIGVEVESGRDLRWVFGFSVDYCAIRWGVEGWRKDNQRRLMLLFYKPCRTENTTPTLIPGIV